jgi:hypothetical protein
MEQAREISRPLTVMVFGPPEDVGDKNGGARGLGPLRSPLGEPPAAVSFPSRVFEGGANLEGRIQKEQIQKAG